LAQSKSTEKFDSEN